MNAKKILLSVIAFSAFITLETAQAASASNMNEELDPFASNISQRLEEMDTVYSGTKYSSKINNVSKLLAKGCYQRTCAVFLDVDKSIQRAQLFVHGNFIGEYATSSGGPGHSTPDMDLHPNGRVYDKYSSSKFPGGDYAGLGNMPYVVFLSGGFAIHGTPAKNWPKLGTAVSHGCIRVHPDNAKVFNRYVRQFGVGNSWVTIR